MPTQHVNLTERNASFVHRQVESGLFKNVSEVHRAALAELERQEELRQAKLARLEAEVQKGFNEIEAGEFTEFSGTDELSQYMDGVLEEVLAAGAGTADAEPIE